MTISAKRVVEAAVGVDDEDIGELEIAEYVVFLLALETYSRYLEEATGSESDDDLIRKGLTLVRMADRQHLGVIQAFLGDSMPTSSQRKIMDKAFRFLPSNSTTLGKRSLQMKIALRQGGASTMRKIFRSNKALREMRAAMAAADEADADAALDKFAVIPLKNIRLRGWIDKAAETAGSGTFQNAVAVASDETDDDVQPIVTARAKETGAEAASEDHLNAEAEKNERLLDVQEKAQDAAERAMAVSGEVDEPPTKSEVVGIATAAAVSVTTDPSSPNNRPAPLRDLDPEQYAASVTDGRVLVAAGAGSGKSRTVVHRVEYLVKDRGVSPSRILVTSFNTKAANELKRKIARLTSTDTLKQMFAGTTHSLFRSFIEKFGTKTEKLAMNRGFTGKGTSVARVVQNMWQQCFPANTSAERKVPRIKDANLAKSKWKGNRITPAEAKELAKTQEQADHADWYEMYEGVKGAIPGWEPPCRSKAYENFMSRGAGSKAKRLGDFDDQLAIFDNILKRDAGVRKTVQDMFDHVIVDEAQDLNAVQYSVISQIAGKVTDGSDGKSLWIVGDDKQCVASDTPILTPSGEKAAKDLCEGDEVLAYRNGGITPQQVKHIVSSNWSNGFKMTTEGGRVLTMSPNHKIWASDPLLKEEQHLLYLMHRRDLGFRIGVTNKGFCEKDSRLLYGQRPQTERAERLWILGIYNSKEEAYTAEALYSLRYQIPTAVYHSEWNRTFPVEKIAAVYKEFGENGRKLLEAKGLKLSYPNWMCRNSRLLASRTIQLIAHGPKGTQVTLEWDQDEALDDKVEVEFKLFGQNRRRIRKWFTNYREGLEFAETLQDVTGFNLSHRLSVANELPLRKITATALFPGMSVAVIDDGELVLDQVVKVEQVEDTFLDLDINDASNFFGGGVLSSNSIYGFRGARPDMFTELNDDEEKSWETKFIRTNYRCEPEIVEAANTLIDHNTKQIPMKSVPRPGAQKGVATLDVITPGDEAQAALDVVEKIKGDMVAGADVSDNAILTRTNKEQHAYETACIIRGVPYARKGTSSFLGSPETKAVLGYVDLAIGNDFAKMQEALGEVINKPNRFFLTGDKGPNGVKYALKKWATETGQDVKTINPLAALADDEFLGILAGALGKKGGLWRKAVRALQEMRDAVAEMKANAMDPDYTTRDLFDEILMLRGTTTIVEPGTGDIKYVEQSFRESLQATIRDSISDEDDDAKDDEDEEEENLGNVSFLYKLMEKDPTDPDDLIADPNTPIGYKAKMDRYAAKTEELRIDIDKWEEKQKELPEAEQKPPPGVYIGTVHSVKGAEWRNCYVAMPRGKFPIEPPKKPGAPPRDPEELQEELESERRLGYVALSRAEMNLTIVCPSTVGGKPAGVSQFVAEAGLHVGENVKRPGETEDETIVEEEVVEPGEEMIEEEIVRTAAYDFEDDAWSLPEGDWD